MLFLTLDHAVTLTQTLAPLSLLLLVLLPQLTLLLSNLFTLLYSSSYLQIEVVLSTRNNCYLIDPRHINKTGEYVSFFKLTLKRVTC